MMLLLSVSIAIHLLVLRRLHTSPLKGLKVQLLNDPNFAGIAILKVSVPDAKRDTTRLGLCTWAEHQIAQDAKAALEELQIVNERRCGRFTGEFFSVTAEAPGDYVFYAVAVRNGADTVDAETALSPTASVRFSVNVKAADKDCVKLSAELPRMAVVTATFGGYDPLRGVHVTDCSGLVDYYTFTDTPDYTHNREVDSHPYHLEDELAQLHPSGKNSLANVTRLSQSRVAMLASKYYKVRPHTHIIQSICCATAARLHNVLLLLDTS
jgi:hypothetical protein